MAGSGGAKDRMVDNIVLRLRYNQSKYVEIDVGDPHQTNLLDVFVDLLEGAEKIGMGLPEQPILWYACNSQNFQLKNDCDLMKMFNSFHDKKLINLAIGSGDSPCKNLELARGLIESKKDVDNAVTPRSSHGTTSMELQLHKPGKKVPATTARRRGMHIPKVRNTSRSAGSEPTSGNLSRTGDVDVVSTLPGGNTHDEEEDDYMVDSNVQNYDLSSLVQEDAEIVEEDYFDRLYDNGEMYEDYEFGKISLKEWMIFMDKPQFLDVLRDYCVQEGFSLVVIRNEATRYTAACAEKECGWRIHSSRLADECTWAIKSLNNNHTCMRLGMHNPMATPAWAARKILQDVNANENITGKTINKLLFQAFGINLKHSSLYEAKKIAEKMLHGDEGKSYASLPGYCEVLKLTNPDSKAHCAWGAATDNPEKPIQFKSVFIALKPMIEGFILGCRGLIGVDGCHLKGKYGGVVLSAIALDGGNHIFPIAYSVYENESKNTWSSFFYHLRELLENAERDNWCIISDRQKGIEPALAEVWPTASRRYCGTHLCANFKKSFPGQHMHDLFWSCCYAYSESKFRKAMERVQHAAGLGAVRWLQELGDMKCWARHKYDPSLHSPDTSSNFVESFNSTLGADRCLPVLTLLEGIRRTCMSRHCERQDYVRKLPVVSITEEAQAILDEAIKKSRKLEVFKASDDEYEVKEGKSSLPVNIPNRTCACGEWQISGIPCRHAVRVINEIRGHPQLYVSQWYSTEMLRRTYSIDYRAMLDEEQWPTFDFPTISPPTMKRGIGRPPRNRKRQAGQKEKGLRSRTVQCSKCKAFGHNAKTCKGGLTARERRELGGLVQKRHKRPRKAMNSDESGKYVADVMCSAPWVEGSQL